jgi:hypothetical protein
MELNMLADSLQENHCCIENSKKPLASSRGVETVTGILTQADFLLSGFWAPAFEAVAAVPVASSFI